MRVKSQVFKCNCPEPADGGVDTKVGRARLFTLPIERTEVQTIYVECPVCGLGKYLLGFTTQPRRPGWVVNSQKFENGYLAMTEAVRLVQAGTPAHIYHPDGRCIADIFPPKPESATL